MPFLFFDAISLKGLAMPGDNTALTSLPRHAVDKLRATTIDLACRLDALIGHLEDELGYAELRIEVVAGVPKFLHVHRSFKLD